MIASRVWIAITLAFAGCGRPLVEIHCVWEADGWSGPDSGSLVAFTLSCEDYQLVGEGFVVDEAEACEADLLQGGATTARCSCEAVPDEACAAMLAGG